MNPAMFSKRSRMLTRFVNTVARSKRPSDEGAFSWSACDAAFVIRRHFGDNPGPFAYTLALYFVLTDIASKEQSPEFTKSYRELAVLSGMGRAQVAKVLNILSELGLVAWQQNFSSSLPDGGGLCDQGPNTYRLLSLNPRPHPPSM